MLSTLEDVTSLSEPSVDVRVETPDDVRRVYRAVIRKIHPDKLRNVTVTQRLEAQELFSVITHAYDEYKLTTTTT